ncbi:MAG: hypothetical protein SXA11_15785 [Cyanobacteriota bacterium]|nr:hypothetical protein [Cyanobacteriota bacterium]
MKRPLDEREMQELLELAKDAEQKALEASELATAIAVPTPDAGSSRS